MRTVYALLLAAACLSISNSNAGDAPLDENSLKFAQALAREGDLLKALPVMFAVMRQTANADLASEARESLERLGITSQEVFKLDFAAMKGEDLDKLLTRLRGIATARRRQEIDFEYGRRLIELSIVPKNPTVGDLTVQVLDKELAQGIDTVIQVALAEIPTDHTREAQALLARMGVSGPRVDTVQKACKEGKVPADVEAQAICHACLSRLEHYRDELQDQEGDVEAQAHRSAVREVGLALNRYLRMVHGASLHNKESSELLEFWQTVTAPTRLDLKR
jgi:hypothetical protein